MGRHPRSSPITVLTPAIGEQQGSPAARLRRIVVKAWARRKRKTAWSVSLTLGLRLWGGAVYAIGKYLRTTAGMSLMPSFLVT